ncbi:MAG: T9SS type A sorting domain-containing protein [Flavobacteriales bacterium]|nr:T9SS type A sorting domain-containing protein [Flavobacteriales bacterium]
MKKLLLLSLLFAFANTIFAGDTTTVRIHDHTDMTWYGNYDEWGELPSDSLTYQKIYLHYTMGCATGGCSDWDYTSKIIVRHRTGEIDSTLQTAPSFTVNGSVIDTVFFSANPVIIYFWDSINSSVDSTLSDSIQIIRYNDQNNPTTPTDTLWFWQSNLEVFSFDSLGSITDTTYFIADTSWIVNYYNWYTPFDVIEDFELARVITPYGSGLANNWEFTHTFDITDFVQILRDSVEIRCHYSGWSSGFSATLDFEFIEGTPPRKVVKVENIYSGGYSYTSTTDFEANKLYPKKFWIEQNSSNAMIKMTTTGHGFDNSQSAAEFKPINYYLNIDGVLTHTQYNWDADCGENPIYPQGGTWIYDRANWCPGKRAQAFNHEITPFITSGDSVEINIDFQSYNWSGTQTPSYIVECQLFQYESANFVNSAEIIDIIKPSLKDEHSRKNPICGKPLIVIRNYGSTTLSSLEIQYKVTGGSTHTFNWIGNLAFLETEEVELPNLTNWSGTAQIFEVTLKNPNGQADDYSDNNSMKTLYDKVPEYPNTFVLWLTTNAGVTNTLTQVSETSWEFFTDNGNSVFSSGNLYSNTPYRDTLTFTNGCYTFVVEDTDEDGLNFWANNDGGGLVRFRDVGAGWLQSFNTDFGTNIIHQFTVGYPQNTTSINLLNNWTIYPNPTKDNLIIEGFSESNIQITVRDNLGKTIINTQNSNSGFISKTIDIDNLSKGIYFIQITNSESNIVKKVVKQ